MFDKIKEVENSLPKCRDVADVDDLRAALVGRGLHVVDAEEFAYNLHCWPSVSRV